MAEEFLGQPLRPEAKNWPDDDEALVEIGKEGERVPENYWCVKDAFEGVQVFGGTGSGKSSGSGKALALAFLESNFGGLVLTAKNDEVLNWKRYAAATGRASDLHIIEPGSPHRFNFLKYELKRPGAGAGHTENLVNLFCTVLEAAERKSGQGGGSDAYWQRTLKQLLRNAIDLAVLALDDVDLPSLYRIITSAARSPAEAEDPKWQQESACYVLLEIAKGKISSERSRADLELTRDFWLREFPSLAPETRSVIVSTFTSMADCFLRGMLREVFCDDVTIRPEDSFAGRILILNFPVKEFNELGQFAQVLFKFVWQRAVERRVPPDIDRSTAQQTIRPVFLWADESQFFVNSYDALFQSTARSSRACTVYLTQNLPSYFAAFGGSGGKASAEAFVANLQTKILHANGDPTTNSWAAETIGKARQAQYYAGLNDSEGKGGVSNQSAGGSIVIQYVVQPQEFTMFRTGGSDCDFQVDSIIFQAGRRWVVREKEKPTAKNFIRHVFNQTA